MVPSGEGLHPSLASLLILDTSEVADIGLFGLFRHYEWAGGLPSLKKQLSCWCLYWLCAALAIFLPINAHYGQHAHPLHETMLSDLWN